MNIVFIVKYSLDFQKGSSLSKLHSNSTSKLRFRILNRIWIGSLPVEFLFKFEYKASNPVITLGCIRSVIPGFLFEFKLQACMAIDEIVVLKEHFTSKNWLKKYQSLPVLLIALDRRLGSWRSCILKRITAWNELHSPETS